MKKLLFILLIILSATPAIFSQTVFASQNAEAYANLIVPLSITPTSGDLDFGEIILTGSPYSPAIRPTSGKLFVVNGHPARTINVTFNDIILDNNLWVAATGGVPGLLTFTPDVELDDGTNVISGDSHMLVLNGGVGELLFWVGGSISIAGNQSHGDYLGLFTLDVSY